MTKMTTEAKRAKKAEIDAAFADEDAATNAAVHAGTKRLLDQLPGKPGRKPEPGTVSMVVGAGETKVVEHPAKKSLATHKVAGTTKAQTSNTINQEKDMAKTATKKAEKAKTERAAREPNMDSFRWTCIEAIKAKPKATHEELAANLKKEHGDSLEKWAKRLSRCRRFAKRKGISLPARVKAEKDGAAAKPAKAKKAKKGADLGDLG